MNNPIIEISNLSYSYENRQIYKDISLQIDQGGVFALLGKNGVGKSTLINILMGFLKPSSGKCLIFGEDSHNLSDKTKQNIALLYEGFISYDFMTIVQIEQYFASFYPKWKKDHFYNLVNLMSVSHDQKLSSLSFGQKSQVILGLLFAQDANLLILDDYSMGLDAGYRKLFTEYLRDYITGTDKTVLITSHIMSDLVGLVDQFVIVQRDQPLFKTTMSEFIKNFKCYKIPLDQATDQQKIHRLEKYRDHQKIYTFETLDEKQIDQSFEDKFLGFVGRY